MMQVKFVSVQGMENLTELEKKINLAISELHENNFVIHDLKNYFSHGWLVVTILYSKFLLDKGCSNTNEG